MSFVHFGDVRRGAVLILCLDMQAVAFRSAPIMVLHIGAPVGMMYIVNFDVFTVAFDN